MGSSNVQKQPESFKSLLKETGEGNVIRTTVKGDSGNSLFEINDIEDSATLSLNIFNGFSGVDVHLSGPGNEELGFSIYGNLLLPALKEAVALLEQKQKDGTL